LPKAWRSTGGANGLRPPEWAISARYPKREALCLLLHPAVAGEERPKLGTKAHRGGEVDGVERAEEARADRRRLGENRVDLVKRELGEQLARRCLDGL
jgi:hypothetical protein